MKKKYKSGLDELKSRIIPMDSEELAKIWRDAEEEKKKKEREAEEKEQKRFNNVKCPVCKSKDKSRIVKGRDNGVFGPGYHYHVEDEYLVCKKCGVMYKDLKK